MKRSLQKFLLSALSLLAAATASAYDVEIDGLYYILYDSALTCCVTFCDSDHNSYSGDIVIPETVSYNGKQYKVTSISGGAFSDCTGLTSIDIPNTITGIGDVAFAGCTSLKELVIPTSVTYLGTGFVAGCISLEKLIIFSEKSEYSISLFGTYGYDDTCYGTVYATPQILNNLRDKNANKVPFFETRTWLKGIDIKLNKDCDFLELHDVQFNGKSLNLTDNWYEVRDLNTGTAYDFSTRVKYGDREYPVKFTESTNTPTLTISNIEPTRTTITGTVTYSSDKTCSLDNLSVSYTIKDSPNNTNRCIDIPIGSGNQTTFLLTGLEPSFYYETFHYTYYLIEAIGNYDGKQYSSDRVEASTRFLSTSFEYRNQIVSPTSIYVAATADLDDDCASMLKESYLEVSHKNETDRYESGIYNEGYEIFNLTGLEPNTKYNLIYKIVITTYLGDYTYNHYSDHYIATSMLELTTLQPKCVSSSCAIVAASTNISEDEPNVGFQWKKYDAPESLAPNEGYAAIYDGQLEGYIRNLQSTSYYNVRAFYKSASGKYYYSDWVTFDPSDFSYFEPTVHTYAAEEVTHNSARVKGYVLAGTDEIDEQGFEYWPTNAAAADEIKTVRAAVETDGNDVSVVLATGQVMTAELKDLKPNTEYRCRAFVKTASGANYGEEQSFTTQPADAGVADAEVEEPTVVGYYDLNGRRLSEPQQGFNIVRYSDGSVKKVILKQHH